MIRSAVRNALLNTLRMERRSNSFRLLFDNGNGIPTCPHRNRPLLLVVHEFLVKLLIFYLVAELSCSHSVNILFALSVCSNI